MIQWKKIYNAGIILLAFSVVLISCGREITPEADQKREEQNDTETLLKQTEEEKEGEPGMDVTDFSNPVDANGNIEPPPYEFIYPEGSTLETRIKAPAGFDRSNTPKQSFLSFTRSLILKPDGSPVLLYDGTEKGNQSAQAAVFDLEVGNRDLQQCADSIIRIYAEYFYSTGDYDKIQFHLTNGFLMEYKKWRAGSRIKVSGNEVKWVSSASENNSYESFRKYLDLVFSYAGTLSLEKESRPIELSELRPGDMFIHGGSPGHCVLVVDMAKDSQGNKSFLLAQGYMPAQEFHLLKNPMHTDNPWYDISELTYPLKTPEYTFQEGSLRRWGGLSD